MTIPMSTSKMSFIVISSIFFTNSFAIKAYADSSIGNGNGCIAQFHGNSNTVNFFCDSPRQAIEPNQQQSPCQYRQKEGSSTTIYPTKSVFSSLEPIRVSLSTNGIPNEYQRWVGVVKAGTPENTSFSYGWTVALDNAPVSLPAQAVGDYQIRLVIKTENAKVLVAYCPITVE